MRPSLKGKKKKSKIRVHEDGRLKKCFTTSKFNMNSVVKDTFFFSPSNNIMQHDTRTLSI